jgi:hypothetical protein
MTDTLLIRVSDVLTRSFAGEVLLASSAGGDIDRLEGSAAVVWDLLEDPRTLADLIARLGHVYREPNEEIRSDLEPLLRDLVERGWVYEIQDTND